jgi:hypothetical protein
MARLVGHLRGDSDILILEPPALDTSADSYAVSLDADATILVVERARARLDELQVAVDQLQRLDVTVLGMVVVSELPDSAPAPLRSPGQPAASPTVTVVPEHMPKPADAASPNGAAAEPTVSANGSAAHHDPSTEQRMPPVPGGPSGNGHGEHPTGSPSPGDAPAEGSEASPDPGR